MPTVPVAPRLLQTRSGQTQAKTNGIAGIDVNVDTRLIQFVLASNSAIPGTILFFRLGDFYEMFNEDAIIGSRELEITLTARHKESPLPIPMCGIPHRSLDFPKTD